VGDGPPRGGRAAVLREKGDYWDTVRDLSNQKLPTSMRVGNLGRYHSCQREGYTPKKSN